MPGAVFTNVLLADEINRTPPRTQAALLESMQEKAVTLDGVRRVISPVFTVLATQNPVEFEGTYPLPEAQRDRFLLKISIDYPQKDEEAQMLSAYAGGRKLSTQMLQDTYASIAREAQGLQGRYLPQMQEQARTLDAGKVLAMVRGRG